LFFCFYFFFQADDGIRDFHVTGVQTCALPIWLKLIANFGVGVDHIDVDAAHARGIAVSNTPGVLTDDTADIALALKLDAARRVRSEERRVGKRGGASGLRAQ